MGVVKIVVKIRCDGCDKPFETEIDRAWKCPAGWTTDDLAIDSVRHGVYDAGMTSIQGDHLLCEACTRLVDNAIEDDEPSHDQVAKVLNEHFGV